MNEEIRLLRRENGMGAEQYGQFYWLVITARDKERTGSVRVFGDSIRVDDTGALHIERKRENGSVQPNMVVAPGAWFSAFACSVIDGEPVAVEHEERDS